MFNFFTVASAILILHKQSGQYLGKEKRSGTSRWAIVPVNKANAIDFKIKQAGINVSKKVDPLTLEDLSDKPKTNLVRIYSPIDDLSFDATSDEVDGNRLLLSSTHNRYQQFMNLTLLPDLTFAIGWKSKCFIYDEQDDSFKTGSCDNLEMSSFEFIKSPKKK